MFKLKPLSRKLIVSFVLLTQVLYPGLAAASPYFQRLAVKDLRVEYGGSLPETRTDRDNDSSSLTRAGGAALMAAPSTIDFASVAVAEQSPVQTVTLTNQGETTLTLGTLSVNDQFTVTNNCDGVVLPALGTCQINVAFAPTQVAPGGVLGGVTVPFTAGGAQGSARINLRGVATPPDPSNYAAATIEGFSGSDASMSTSASGEYQIAFGNALQGRDTLTKTFSIHSTGSAALAFRGVVGTGGAGAFSQTNNCPATIAPGDACSVTVTFAPTISQEGPFTGTLTLSTSSATGNTIAVKVSGTATSNSSFSLSSAALNIGSVPVGQSVTQSFLVLNGGTTPLEAPSVSTTGSGLTSSNNCPAVLGLGEACTVSVTFEPATPANYSGYVTVSFAGASFKNISVNATGTGPMLVVDSANQSFGVITPGSSKTLTYTVTNAGNALAPLTISASPEGVNSAVDCGATLAAGAVCHLAYTYSPAVEGSVSGGVTVSSTLNSLTLSMSGTSVGIPGFTASTSNLAFGNVAPSANASLSLLFTNTGSLPLEVPLLMLTGSSAFSASHNCPATIAVNSSCTVTVLFAPTQISAALGSLVLHTGLAVDQTVSLSGVGAASVLGLSASQAAFGNVNILSAKTENVLLSNSGNTPASLTFGALPANVSLAHTCGSTLAANAQCQVSLTYLPLQESALSGSLTISSQDSSVTLSMTGTPVSAPGIALSATALTFNGVQLDSSASQSIEVLNNGNVPVSKVAVQVSGFGYSTGNDCPPTLAVGESCVVTVAYSPTSVGASTGALTVSVDGVAAQSATLQGIALGAILNVDGANKSFGAVAIGSQGSLTYTVTNAGNIAAALSYSQLPPVVTRAGTCDTTLAAGASCTVVLTYAPVDTSSTAGSLAVTAPHASTTLGFSGSGLALPATSVSSSSLNVGNVATGATQTAFVTLQNSGNVSLDTPVVSITGAAFTVTHDCPSILAVGATCQATVSFAPTAPQAYTGTLSLEYSGVPVRTVAVSGVGQAVALSVDAAQQAFGNVSIGATVSRTYTVTNTGNISGTVVIGAVAAPVAKAGTCGASLTAGASCTVVLSYSPTDTATVNDSLTVQVGDKELVLSYSGTGVALPSMTVSSYSLNLGNVAVNANASTTVSVYNAGNVPLSTPAIASSGDAFSVAHNCPATLAVGASCQATVTFAPTAPQGYSGTLSVAYADVSQQTVTLSGTGRAAVLSASTTSQDFGSVAIGATSSKTTTITNNGNLAASLSYSPVSAPFSRSGTCSTTLAVGASCTVVLIYAPTDSVTSADVLTASAPNTSVTVNYSGTGQANPAFSLSTAGLSFGSVVANASSTLNIQVSNTGNVPLAQPAISSTGTGYATNSNCPATLAVGASCQVTATFTPTSYGPYSGTVSVGWTGVSAVTASLSGTGLSASLSATPNALDFAGVNILATKALTTTVSNAGNLPAALTYAGLTGGVTQSGTCGATLAASTSCTVVLTYAPTSTATTSGTLTVSATNTSAGISYAGTGVALPSFSLSTAALAFGSVLTGFTSSASTVTVTNTGNVSLATPSVSVTGTGYSQTHNCPATLVVGATCTVSLTFAPTVVQAYSESLNVSIGGLSAKTVSLTGNGIASYAVALTLSSNVQNYVLNTAKVAGYVPGRTAVTLTINSGVYVWSDSTALPALKVDSSWLAGDTLTIVNNGYVMGKGGKGGDADCTVPTPGGAGGPAMSTSFAVAVNNTNGYLLGGGGGGGASSGYAGGGGGAGGGAGGDAFPSAKCPGGTGVYGGAPGAVGQPGSNGAMEPASFFSGGGGGGRVVLGSITLGYSGAGTGVFNASATSFGIGGTAGGAGGWVNPSTTVRTAGAGGSTGPGGNTSGWVAKSNNGGGGGGGGWGAAGGNAIGGGYSDPGGTNLIGGPSVGGPGGPATATGSNAFITWTGIGARYGALN